jgi:hypothetical protein
MLKQRRLAAETVAEALFAAEQAIDAAITRTATLAGLMPSTRQDANLSAMIGQDALMGAIETMQALGVAREGIVTTHKHLSIAQRDIGLSALVRRLRRRRRKASRADHRPPARGRDVA